MPRPRKRLKVWKATVGGKYVIRWQWDDEDKPQQEATGLKAVNSNAPKLRKLIVAKEESLLAERKSGVSWQLVKDRYRLEKLAHQKKNSARKWGSAMNAIDKFAPVSVLSEVDEDMLSRFGAKLREKELAPDTIIGYLREIGRMLTFAEEIWREYRMPKIRKPKGVKRSGMKGRPIVREEFERMLDKTESVVGAEFAESWRYYLTGLYLSGLRLAESLQLTWDDPSTMHVISLDLGHPRIHVPDYIDKAGRDEGLPITTDFAVFLDGTLARNRRGRVFRPMMAKGIPSYWTVSDIISAIGHEANVLVWAKGGTAKTASAHDLRRAFGTRWAPHMMPADLQLYMRHQSIQTTMKFYVDLEQTKAAARTKKAAEEYDLIIAAKELASYQPKKTAAIT